MWNPLHPPPAPPSFGQDKVIPEDSANWLSQLVFEWLSPILSVGFSRPLQQDDLYKLPPYLRTENVTERLESNFYARCPPEQRSARFRPRVATTAPTTDEATRDDEKDGMPHEPSLECSSQDASAGVSKSRFWFSRPPTGQSPVNSKGQPQYDASILMALNATFFTRWWTAGILRFAAAIIQITLPLLIKRFLSYLTLSFAFHRLPPEERVDIEKPQGIGYGIGLAFALFAMQEASSIFNNHYQVLAMKIGLSARMGLIGMIFRKSLRLSGKARAEHNVGQITTMISTDATRMDLAALGSQEIWVAPIQIIIGIALLINNLGASALVGLGVMLLSFPVQAVCMVMMFKTRESGVKVTDTRVRLTGEVLQGIRLIKYYAWERFYINQIGELRGGEVKMIKRSAFIRAWLIAIVSLSPVLAAVLTFITYHLTGHELNVAVVFSSLSLFNTLLIALVLLPFGLQTCSDAAVALKRIGAFLVAEESPEPYGIDRDPDNQWAIRVKGDFQWETVGPVEAKFDVAKEAAETEKDKSNKGKKAKTGSKKKQGKKKEETQEEVLPVTSPTASSPEKSEEEKKPEEPPFGLKDLDMSIPKGAFVSIVGRVGCGKSSILQALIGEMRRNAGEVTFAGSVAYVAQTAWIQNATLRANITFGMEEDETRFRSVVTACALDHDLEILPHGENTEIGEKGINLSGGQKARVSLARAAYANADIVLLDDPLSAVDSYVGRSILENCLLSGPLANKTRVLVTHALHVLDKTDYIYVMDGGAIVEQGTYSDLLRDGTLLPRIIEEHVRAEDGAAVLKDGAATQTADSPSKDGAIDKKAQTALMQEEEREVGAVTWATYAKYAELAGSLAWVPLILFMLVLVQAASVSSTLFLGFWSGQTLHGFSQNQYMAVYAGLGVAQAVLQGFFHFAFSWMGLIAGLRLFKVALTAVLRSPSSFFDTTPIGRIISRMSKDQDTVDNELVMSAYQLCMTFGSALDVVVLVFYIFPLLGTLFPVLIVLYWAAFTYYRRTSVEVKRLDSLMRSALYASFTETFTGLSTVRAYKAQSRFIEKADEGLDWENRAYYLTVTIQRWLSIRLDLFGNVLLLGIALFAVGFRHTVNPAKTGVIVSYALQIIQYFGEAVTLFAQNEQNMNAVERILAYTELPPEGIAESANDPPPNAWPTQGEVKFEGVEMAYRPGLPSVLKDVTFVVRPGEKIGIVGRTGAGKSSLLQALFRIVELQGGKIEIDGRNISDIGLDTLRTRLALVPQDPTLFLGTLRENLDPEKTRTDAEIISALQRTWLLPADGSVVDPAVEKKFSLDSTVGDEGSNYSAGERQLLALCRALVKNSRIIVLDEATSSVDSETDANIQRTIQSEFAGSTLLCIAHRLHTICGYDRVLVMDAGCVAEFDEPLKLWDMEDGIFRKLCDEARLKREDIERIRAGMMGSQRPDP